MVAGTTAEPPGPLLTLAAALALAAALPKAAALAAALAMAACWSLRAGVAVEGRGVEDGRS